MRNYGILKSVGLRFYAQDAAGGGSGAAASGAAGSETIKTPLDDIPLDELDPKLKTLLEKAKSDIIATLQLSAKDKADLAKTIEQSKGFQSQADKFAAELRTLKEKLGPDLTKDNYLEAARDVLQKHKFKSEDVESMAPAFADMLRRSGEIIKGEVKKALEPLAASTLATQARTAWDTACGQDSMQMLTIPEVADKTWAKVKEFTDGGHLVNPELILNLAKQNYVDHQIELKKAGKSLDVLPDKPPMPSMRTSPPFHSSATIPLVTPPIDPNAPKTTPNEDTLAALGQTFRTMGKEQNIYPKAFKPAAK